MHCDIFGGNVLHYIVWVMTNVKNVLTFSCLCFHISFLNFNLEHVKGLTNKTLHSSRNTYRYIQVYILSNQLQSYKF